MTHAQDLLDELTRAGGRLQAHGDRVELVRQYYGPSYAGTGRKVDVAANLLLVEFAGRPPAWFPTRELRNVPPLRPRRPADD